jgi:hypothetical protein
MSFRREGIENVRAFTLPDGIAADGSCAAISSAVLVTWRSIWAGMLHQVYINGRFAGATVDAEQRQLVVQPPGSFQSAVCMEVVAVEPTDAQTDFADDLDPPPASGRVRLSILRSQTLPLGGTADVYFDNGSGQIDYGTPLNPSPIVIWPCFQDKAGFGTAQFGAGDFGYDSAACVGFGKGSFASGPFGMDADIMEWISPLLPLGRYRFGVKIRYSYGNESAASETAPIAVVPPAKPAAALSIAAFDPQTNQLTPRVSDE